MYRPAMIALTALLLTLGAPPVFGSDEIPGPPQKGPTALVGPTVHPVSSTPIDDATLLFDRGRIVAVGRKVRLPKGVKQIDARGLDVYPGLINAYGNLGLVEIRAVRATRDYSETGSINPNARAEVAVNPDSELIPVTRSGGVLLSLTVPSGGLISGTSALLQLDGWTYEEMALLAPAGMHVRWPAMRAVAKVPKSEGSDPGERDPVAPLQKAFDDARAYQKARSADPTHPRDARWEAMLPVLDGRLPLVVSADRIERIQAAVAFAVGEDVKLILLGGYDAPECAELLKQHDVPVIVSSVHRLPIRRDDDYDAAYSLPARLHASGVRFCIACGGASNVRNLPFEAGTAAGFGLPSDEALKAITLYPAEILGAADRVGSLEPDKDATLIVTDGDPLEASTQVKMAFIQGRAVDLSNRHTRLWQKYQEKYRRGRR